MSWMKSSMRNKLILFLLIATIVPIVTSIVITYYYTKESVKRNAIRENANLLFQGKTNLLNYFNILNQSTLVAYSNVYLFNILLQGYQNTSDEKNELIRGLQTPYRAVNEVYQLHLDFVRGEQNFLLVGDLPHEGWKYSSMTKGSLTSYDSYMEPTHMSHNYGVAYYPQYPSVPVFSLHRPIYKIPSTERIGTLSVDVKLDFVEQICKELFQPGTEDLYLLDENGIVVYGTHRDDWGKPLDREWVAYLKDQHLENGNFEWKEKGFQGIEVFQKLETPYMNWTLVKQIPYSHLYQNAREMTTINVAVYSLFLIIVIAATVVISFRFTAPIRALIGTINKIQTGKLNADIEVIGTDEMGILARRFRIMMQTINDLILREYTLELANKTNELKALQAQINPHFLNNALQSIGTLALQHQEMKIYYLIYSLGKMMRYHMNVSETIVPLSREIEYVKGYLELQQQRFDEHLHSEITVDPQAQNLELPKMTLQPIVENYFKHGHDSHKAGKLSIECVLEGADMLVIRVTDNGKGMEPEEIELLNEKLERGLGIGGDGSESIGLVNVISRLKLYFNENARMIVSVPSAGGLQVELHVPLKNGGDKHESTDR